MYLTSWTPLGVSDVSVHQVVDVLIPVALLYHAPFVILNPVMFLRLFALLHLILKIDRNRLGSMMLFAT